MGTMRLSGCTDMDGVLLLGQDEVGASRFVVDENQVDDGCSRQKFRRESYPLFEGMKIRSIFGASELIVWVRGGNGFVFVMS